jgi:hypothetical protein
MPLPQTRAELASVDVDAAADLMDGAPPVDIDVERNGPAIPWVAKRAKPESLPEESFADIDADLADHAPNAPVTPWRGLPSLQADPVDITPPRGTPIDAINFRGDDARESEPEPTIVGKVPDNLMELSAAGADENTRAFTAPRELIELAKRKRDERDVVNSNVSLPPSARPPGRGGARIDYDNQSSLAAPNVPVESVSPADPESHAAPPVARTASGEMEAVALPSRTIPRSEPPIPSGPEIEIDPGSALSPSAYRAIVGDAAKAAASPVSEAIPSALRRPVFKLSWLLLMVLFVVGGVIIARWRELAVVFR